MNDNNINNQNNFIPNQNVVEPMPQPIVQVQTTVTPGVVPEQENPAIKNEEKKSFFNNKTVLIIGGILLLIILLLGLYFTVFKKPNNYDNIEDYYQEQLKIEERINKNYELKDYKVLDGILIEINNKNKEMVDVDLTIEFYDENGSPVDVEKGYIFNLNGKSTGYDKISTFDINNYSTYKITAKLSNDTYATEYNKKIKILDGKVQGEDYIFQIKNEADVKIKTIEIGIFYYGKDNTIIDFDSESFNDINSNETITGKSDIPYDFSTHKSIEFDRVETKVLYAINMNN